LGAGVLLFFVALPALHRPVRNRKSFLATQCLQILVASSFSIPEIVRAVSITFQENGERSTSLSRFACSMENLRAAMTGMG
jgi:hypothetical protein